MFSEKRIVQDKKKSWANNTTDAAYIVGHIFRKVILLHKYL